MSEEKFNFNFKSDLKLGLYFNSVYQHAYN